ncbi:MAG: bifunctional hydroxymethylpyrimidine kinase/phosphomethylpyrimidine kinase [Lautropia sp.]|nr:MAG: bifunctional hydroxymethylpyrimidine kinase/phosphomethylpyrimidine kinase [Pseudomonadota bacterium]MBC6960327.1 bifunctional hydroxymethylpyrimidine kinase/phosphomethylpyrimidine kinase [Lautropia sp.]MCL4702199.1 bifunctional hydroxymethylpyrimidine kinase/phosphomethylpyrimidine kinase [Burkholderiaceae bacterium]MCZ2413205.1 bifunctional hydroxymethylpyrimidine kinase/phosphomethylpyrimidine kinase [Burkholderiales bacterium]MDL1908073.1 bifunctional hydroxymethylpyrimidine kinase
MSTSKRSSPPNALSVAGIDPSGGAGIFADLKAFSALGAYGTGVVAALTAQNTQGVAGVHGVPPPFVRLQLDTLFADVRIDAAKVGMLGTAEIAIAVAEGLAPPVSAGRLPHLVVDPVMVAKSGDALLGREAIATLIEAVLPLATVLTPNLPEAGVLLGARPADTTKEMQRAAERLRRLLRDDGQRFVLLKGGHLAGDATDLLFDGDRMIELTAPRVATRNTHGTGCTLSAAIAALLAHGIEPVAAVRQAKQYLTEALRQADRLDVGSGHGPVHHFHAWWPRA